MALRAAAATAGAFLLLFAAPAWAVDKAATCTNLQTVLDGAANGDVITLNSSDGTSGFCTGHYTLPSFAVPGLGENWVSWQLQGDPTNGIDGFDGSALTTAQRMLMGTNVHVLELRSLTFRNGNVDGDGAAIAIDGDSSPRIRLSTFLNNTATYRGGAVYLSQNPVDLAAGPVGPVAINDNTFTGNKGGTGGAVSVVTSGQTHNSSFMGNTFVNNVATGNGGAFDYALAPGGVENFSLGGNQVINNKAGGSGGGGHVAVATSMVYVDNELYQGNSVEPVTGSTPVAAHQGGGLWIEADNTNLITHRNNVYRNNSIKPFVNASDYLGGGLAITSAGLNVASQYSRFESNSVPAAFNVDHVSQGGGVFLDGAASWYGFLDAIAGNSTGAAGTGGGMYLRSSGETALTLGEVSVAGNSSGGALAGLAGGGNDDLTMRNSIVYNAQQPDIGGFDAFDLQYSDACQNGAPFSGPGNICADPKLAGGADVHQTKQSPTIDKGSDALFSTEGGERNNEDYERDPRPTDGDGDGHTVDMGADETPAGFAVPPPPPPPPTPQCSDGADNDGDGAIDSADPGCLAGPTDNNEGDETPRDLILCGQRAISLVRADVKGSKVVLSGIVAASVAGQKVQLSVRYLGGRAKPAKLGSVTPAADGQFQASVRTPSKQLLNLARYRAQVGGAKSVELKLPQSLASTSLKRAAGGTLELRGQVDRTLLGKRNPVVIKRILCGKYGTVGQAKPNKKGAYVVRFPAPQSQGSALYRAETTVRARPGSKRYVKQFARAIGITF
jgi:hypothetical protein